MKKTLVITAIFVAFFLVTYLSWPKDEYPSLKHDAHHGIVDEVYHHEFHEDSTYKMLSSVAHLGTLDTIGVHEMGYHFYIPRQESDLLHFPCNNCHNANLDEIKAKNEGLGKKAHWNIELKHASSDVMNCQTCHTNNNMNELHSITNQKINFNNSFQVCAQCHQQQYKDWTGGAHGKRIGGWAKPVVKNTCVNCHNPHSPSFGHRLPSRLNTKMIEQRK